MQHGVAIKNHSTSRYSRTFVTVLVAWFAAAHAAAYELKGIVDVATGQDHTCAITESGAVKCWGSNSAGELGFGGPTTFQTTVVNVLGLGERVTAVAGGRGYTCAITVAGGVKCWGRNNGGDLGDGTTVGRMRPVDVATLSTGVRAIAAGSGTCALTVAGGVKCWGASLDGIHPLPTDMPGLTTGIVAISAGERFVCALTAADVVMCWGFNLFGALGDGTQVSRTNPAPVVGLSRGIAALATGTDHACALTAIGAMQCWGGNAFGEVGDGTTVRRLSPVDVKGLAEPVKSIAAGGGHTCAILVSGRVQCWGSNNSGELGANAFTHQSLPVDVLAVGANATGIAATRFHTCAVLNDRSVRCWGANYVGQLGAGFTSATETNPLTVTAQDRVAVEFHNATLDHYFITTDPIEIAATENGSAGPGWTRTGGSFKSAGATDVCRFYGSYVPGPNSHFYAVDGAECQGLFDSQLGSEDARRSSTKSWNFESFDFTTTRPLDGACPADTVPVYRAYNNGFARGVDSNHRITADRSAVAAVVARGWTDEGVVMCAPR